jgi:outer membrane lipoprotein-sorting protein
MMMKKNCRKILVFVLLISAASGTHAQAVSPAAEEILRKVDENEIYKSITYEGEMIIEYRGKRFVKTFKGFARENNDSFMEFTNREDRGTKYLKKDGRLYVYSPDTEQVMLISGHLLKESMMGSDLSYEDTIENEKLSVRYRPVIALEEMVDGRETWVLELTARRNTESYQKQKLWVAKDNFDVLKSEYYALSGAMLKQYRLIRSENISGRSFPVESEMRDLLRKDSRTVFVMRNVNLDKPLSDSVFSMRNLQR